MDRISQNFIYAIILTRSLVGLLHINLIEFGFSTDENGSCQFLTKDIGINYLGLILFYVN